MNPRFRYIQSMREYLFRYEDEPRVRSSKSMSSIFKYMAWYERPDRWWCDNWKNHTKRKKQYLRHRRG